MERKKKILIVEDNSHLRELLALLLRRSEFEVVEAATGCEAINQACASLPNLILMDLDLPDMNGAEAMSRLKINPATRDIPVIVNTAFLHGPIVEQAIAAGAAAILHKPVELKVLLDTLRRYLAEREQRVSSSGETVDRSFQAASKDGLTKRASARNAKEAVKNSPDVTDA